jgi:hypothetical protein
MFYTATSCPKKIKMCVFRENNKNREGISLLKKKRKKKGSNIGSCPQVPVNYCRSYNYFVHKSRRRGGSFIT